MVLGGVALVPVTTTSAQSGQVSATNSTENAKVPKASRLEVPGLPKGKSTLEGGTIRDVDPVRDQFTLDVYGIKPMKIFFDERTQLYRDGKRIPLHDLGPAAHASVQTMLDGAQVFAVSVHILSEQPQGAFQGRVVDYDPDSGELTLAGARGGEPFRVMVTKDTSIARKGQSEFASGRSGVADLVKGSLVSLSFDSSKGRGYAREITVLAAPGASFIFSGTVVALNMPGGVLVVMDPRYQTDYQISFDTHMANVGGLRVGQHVRVTADYDGTRYVATGITKE